MQKAIIAFLMLALFAASAQADYLGIFKSDEYIVFEVEPACDSSGIAQTPDSMHAVTYLNTQDDTVYAATGAGFSLTGIDTTTYAGEKHIRFRDQVQDIDGTGGNGQLFITISSWIEGMPFHSKASATIISDTLQNYFTDIDFTRLFVTDSLGDSSGVWAIVYNAVDSLFNLYDMTPPGFWSYYLRSLTDKSGFYTADDDTVHSNIVRISDDKFAAINLEHWCDGTGYQNIQNRIGSGHYQLYPSNLIINSSFEDSLINWGDSGLSLMINWLKGSAYSGRYSGQLCMIGGASSWLKSEPIEIRDSGLYAWGIARQLTTFYVDGRARLYICDTSDAIIDSIIVPKTITGIISDTLSLDINQYYFKIYALCESGETTDFRFDDAFLYRLYGVPYDPRGDADYAVTIVTMDTSATPDKVVPKAKVTILNPAGDSQASAGPVHTSSAGRAVFSLPTDSFMALVSVTGYYFLPDTIVVSGSQTDTIKGISLTIPVPDSTGVCRVYGNMKDFGYIDQEGVRVTATYDGDSITVGDYMIVNRRPIYKHSDSTGQWFIDLIPNVSVDINSTYKFEFQRSNDILMEFKRIKVPTDSIAAFIELLKRE